MKGLKRTGLVVFSRTSPVVRMVLCTPTAAQRAVGVVTAAARAVMTRHGSPGMQAWPGWTRPRAVSARLSARNGSLGWLDRPRQASTGVVIGWHGSLGWKRQVAVTAMPLTVTLAPALVSVVPLTGSSRMSADAAGAGAAHSASTARTTSPGGQARIRALMLARRDRRPPRAAAASTASRRNMDAPLVDVGAKG